jgi:TRAP-type C4-dicarboxylate transport system permease small subunit
MSSIERGIVWVCQVILWVSTSVIFIILCANTVLRYATGSSLQWANELPETLFPWLVMSGVVIGAVHGSHITTSFLRDRLAPAAQRWLSVVANLAVTGLYVTLSLATWRMLEIVHDEKSPILGVPGSVTYSCVMVGMIMLALIALANAWRAATGRQPGVAETVNANIA